MAKRISDLPWITDVLANLSGAELLEIEYAGESYKGTPQMIADLLADAANTAEGVSVEDPDALLEGATNLQEAIQVLAERPIATDVDLRGDLANGDDEGKGASLIMCKPSALSGAVARALDIRLADYVSVKDFGAVGDGVTDDAAAIQAAITAASHRGVFFPAGTYLSSAKITAPTGSFVIFGEASGVSEVRFTSATTTAQGFAASLSADTSDYFHVGGLTISTTTGYAAGKHALQIDGTAQISGDYIVDRSYRRGGVRDVVIRGISTATGWDIGARFTSVTAFYVDHYTFWGEDSEGSTTGNWQGEGIRIDGAGVPVEMKLTNVWVHSGYYAVRCPDYLEGLYIGNHDFVNVRHGVVAKYAAGVSVLAEANCGCLQPTIGAGHIKCYISGIDIVNVNQAFLHDLNIYVASQPATSNYGGVFLSNGANNRVRDVSVTETGTSTNSAWGVVFDNIDRSFISRVSSYGLRDSAVYLKNDSDDNLVVNCLAYDCINAVITDSTSAGNWLIKNKGMSLSSTLYGGTAATNNYIENRSYAVSKVVTLAGGATSEEASVAIPPGVFSAKPSVILPSVESSAQNLVCAPAWDSASTTATNMVIKVFRNDGASITGGSVRLHVVAYE